MEYKICMDKCLAGVFVSKKKTMVTGLVCKEDHINIIDRIDGNKRQKRLNVTGKSNYVDSVITCLNKRSIFLNLS